MNVSTVMSVYNPNEFLEKQLDSIRNQSSACDELFWSMTAQQMMQSAESIPILKNILWIIGNCINPKRIVASLRHSERV